MMDLLINNSTYLEELKSQTLKINKTMKDMEGEFSLLLPINLVSSIDIGADVRVTDDGISKFGGIIAEIEYERYRDITRANIKCVSYKILATNKNVILPAVTDPDAVLDKAEILVHIILDQFLTVEGIIEGYIESNIKINDGTYEDDETKSSISEKLDDLCDKTGCQWYIDADKRFFFYRGVKEFQEFPTAINWDSDDFRDVKVNKQITDYRNRQIVKGGEPSVAVEDSELDEDGNIYIVQDDALEIFRMKAMSGGEGIWENIEENVGITTPDEARKCAQDLLDKYGKPPVTLEFTTFDAKYSVGDFLYINIPQFNINNAKFTVEEIDIEDMGAEVLQYSLKTSMRNNNSAKDNFYDFMSRMAKNKATTNKNKDMFVDTVGVQIQEAITTSADIIFS